MKKILTALALSLVTLVPTAFAADTPAPAKPIIKIGASLQLTGGIAHHGEDMRDAILLAKENLPKDTKFEYELVIEDDAFEPKKTALVTNKFVSIDKVDAILSFGAGTGAVISPIAEQNKIIHFGQSLTSRVAEGDFNFISFIKPEEEARVMIEQFLKRGIKKIALFSLNMEGPLAVSNSIKKEAIANDIEVVFEDIANFGEKDFRTSILKAKATNPDIYIPIFFSPELEILTKQIREAGIVTPLTTVELFGGATEPELFEGLWFVDATNPKSSFTEGFKERYGKDTLTYGSFSYDAFNIIVQGYETAAVAADAVDGKPTQEAVIEAIHKVDMEGLRGKITMDEAGWVFYPATVKVMKNGKPVLLDSAQ